MDEDGREAPLRVAIMYVLELKSSVLQAHLHFSGGGIGGLALATFLSTLTPSQSDRLKVDIFEASPSLAELGAGVGVWLRTWRILEAAASGKLAEDLKVVAPPGRVFTDGSSE